MKKLLLISILGILLLGSLVYAGLTLSKEVTIDKELITDNTFRFEEKAYDDGTYDIRVYVDTEIHNYRTGENTPRKALIGYKYNTLEPEKAYQEIVSGYLYRQKISREKVRKEIVNEEIGTINLKESIGKTPVEEIGIK